MAQLGWFPESHSFTAPVQHSFMVIHSASSLASLRPGPEQEWPQAQGPGIRHPQVGMASKPSVCPRASGVLGLVKPGGVCWWVSRSPLVSRSCSQLTPPSCPGRAWLHLRPLQQNKHGSPLVRQLQLPVGARGAGRILSGGQGLPLLQSKLAVLGASRSCPRVQELSANLANDIYFIL